jgi:pyrroline-5-carboxylate reductase
MALDLNFDVGIIGVGIMGEALLANISKSVAEKRLIRISDKIESRVTSLQDKYECSTSTVSEIAGKSKVIMLVVKPQDMEELLKEIGNHIFPSQRVVSFSAGKSTHSIEKYLNEGVPVLRVMPNTPMSLGVGASAISKGKYATDEDVKAIQDLLKASGKIIVVDESLQDAVTATSGSGPAYFFRFVEAMIDGAQNLGLSEADARTLVIQTITGAAAMLNVEGADPGVLCKNVTSPNGTTYAALQVFEGGDLEGLVKRAMKAARDRSQELS